MRSLTLSLLILVLALLAQPAHADITANYHVWGPLGPTMKVQVAENGDARVELGGGLAGIRRGGVMYLVREDAAGSFVLRHDEFQRIEAQQPPHPALTALMPDLRNASIVEAGEETVGGRKGIILLMKDEAGQTGDSEMAWVVSPDPDLRPVGSIVATFFGAAAPFLGGAFADVIRAVHDRGALIRMWFMLRLEETTDEPIPASAFDLPGPILSGEEAKARLGPAW